MIRAWRITSPPEPNHAPKLGELTSPFGLNHAPTIRRWIATKERVSLDERKEFRLAGSETRQRQKAISFRCTDAEHEIIKAMADIRGAALADYCRSQVLKKPLSRATRNPSASQVEVSRLIGQLGSLQETLDNINPTDEFSTVLADIHRELSGCCNLLIQSQGRKP